MLVLVGRVHRLVLIACFGACMTQVAAATDMGVFSLTPPSPQNKDWSGFYSRSGSSDGPGPSWMNSTGMNSTSFSSPGASRPATTSDSFGYNLQKGNFVFGVEGSFSAANFDGRFTSPNFTAAGAWSPNMNWLGTVTGRFGYSFGQWLPYVKGGFAAASVGSSLQDGPLGGFTQASSGQTQTGWTAGVGLEYQLSSKWSLGLEYLYTDLNNGSGTGAPNSIGAGGSPEVYTTAVKSQSLLGRLNYKAGW
jgi:opacity protein-like surface antigen